MRGMSGSLPWEGRESGELIRTRWRRHSGADNSWYHTCLSAATWRPWPHRTLALRPRPPHVCTSQVGTSSLTIFSIVDGFFKMVSPNFGHLLVNSQSLVGFPSLLFSLVHEDTVGYCLLESWVLHLFLSQLVEPFSLYS